MSRVIPAYVLQAKQRKARASERFEEENQRLEAHTRATKCCTLITTGAHPEHDTLERNPNANKEEVPR